MITSNSKVLKPDKDWLEVTGKYLTCSKCRNVAGPPGYTRIRNTATVGNAGHKFRIYQGLAKKKSLSLGIFLRCNTIGPEASSGLVFYTDFLHPSLAHGELNNEFLFVSHLCFSTLLLWEYLLHFSCSLQMCTLCRKWLKFQFKIPLDELHWVQPLYRLLVIWTNHQWQG